MVLSTWTFLKCAGDETNTNHNIKCSECGQGITGIRYKCGQCSDFNLCSSCEIKDNHIPSHYFIRIHRSVDPSTENLVVFRFASGMKSICRSNLISIETYHGYKIAIRPEFTKQGLENLTLSHK
jgi:hypothetical protein